MILISIPVSISVRDRDSLPVPFVLVSEIIKQGLNPVCYIYDSGKGNPSDLFVDYVITHCPS